MLPQARNARQNTALHFAHERGNIHIQKLIVENGGHKSKMYRNSLGLTPENLTPSHYLSTVGKPRALAAYNRTSRRVPCVFLQSSRLTVAPTPWLMSCWRACSCPPWDTGRRCPSPTSSPPHSAR